MRFDEEGCVVVLEPTRDPVMCMIHYRAIHKVVELYVDGRMHHGDVTQLAQGGWTFKIEQHDRV